MSLAIQKHDALIEKMVREKARRHVIPFAEYMANWYVPGNCHRHVAEKLEQVHQYIKTGGREGIGRLIINMPFRHGKSELVTRLFSAFVLGTLPSKRVMVTSYGADLAEDDSRKVREYVESDRFSALFGQLSTQDDASGPVEVSQVTRKRANWSLENHRGGVTAAGIGGGIVGKGADLLIVDDPYKRRDEADSESYRKMVMRWFRGSAYTRLEKGGAIIIIHTRWHPQDLTGELLAEMASGLGEEYEVVHLPMLALETDQYPSTQEKFTENLLGGVYIPRDGDPLQRKPGAALWPEKFDEAAAARIRQNILEDEFLPQAQQLPEQASGGFFDERDFTLIDRAPEGLRWFVYIDLALGKSESSDYNAAVAEAMDANGYLYLRDMLRERKLEKFLDDLVDWMLDPEENNTTWAVEDVSFQSLVFMEFMKDARLANKDIRTITPQDDKVTRARALRRRAKKGFVKLVRGKWCLEFTREAMSFPTGKHDDQVDTASGGLQLMAEEAINNQGAASSAALVVSATEMFV